MVHVFLPIISDFKARDFSKSKMQSDVSYTVEQYIQYFFAQMK